MRCLPSLILTTILAGLACSQPRFSHLEAPAFRISGYRSLALDPRGDRALVREGYRPAEPGLWLGELAAPLSSLGYRWVPEAEADLWVGFHILRPAPREGSRERPRKAAGKGQGGGGAGHSGGGGRGSGVRTGEPAAPGLHGGGGRGEILLVLQLMDRRTGEVVWQGEGRPETGGDAPIPAVVLRRLLGPLTPL